MPLVDDYKAIAARIATLKEEELLGRLDALDAALQEASSAPKPAAIKPARAFKHWCCWRGDEAEMQAADEP